MPRRPPLDPEPTRYRRRVILELTPDEMTLLDDATGRHGTKRAALVAALRTEAAGSCARRARASKQARSSTGSPGADPAPDPELVAEGKRLRAELATLTDRLATLTKERDAARTEAQELRHKLDAEYAESRARYRSYVASESALEERIPDALYCARCEAWTPETEWTRRPDGTDKIVFHTPCGDHGPGVLSSSSWLARHTGPEKSTP